jgi:methylmalonyl-CoA mutase N-terminal domain/subunit
MWAKIMRERFGAKTPKSWTMRFHTQTAGSTLTAQQVDNNVVRVALQALAAVMGGTQSLHTNSRDEALALPTEESARLALRTQQLIAAESGVADFVDPLAGSYVVEQLTDELEADALALIAEVDSRGGMVSAIEAGFPQREIQNAAYRTQLAMDRGEQEVVGVNVHQDDSDPPPDLLKVDASIGREQCERLGRFKAERNAGAVDDSLDALQQAASGSENLMPHIIHAVKSDATLGEIADGLRTVFGEYQEQVVI